MSRPAASGAATGMSTDHTPMLLVEEEHDIPLVRMTVTLRRGATEDPPGLEGLAQFAAELARRGAGGMSRQVLDARFDALGADLAVSVGPDAITWDVSVLAARWPDALALLADVVLRPDLKDDEAEQLRRETEADLDELEEDDPQLARRFFARALFAESPYGRPSLGTRASIARLDAEHARRFLERAVSAGNLIIGAAGDVDRDRFAAAALRRFGVLRPGAAPRAELPRLGPRPNLHLTLVDKPERTQTQILLGQPICAWADPDFIPLSVATNALGGTFTARLMTEVRVKRGLSYGVSARLGQGRGPRALQMYLFPSIERTGEALGLVLDLWRAWVKSGITDEELAFSRENLASSFVFDRVTPEDRLDLRTAIELCGLPVDYLTAAPARIRAVTHDDVRAAMERTLAAEGLTLTLLTTADKLGDQLAPLGLTDGMTRLAYDRF